MKQLLIAFGIAALAIATCAACVILVSLATLIDAFIAGGCHL